MDDATKLIPADLSGVDLQRVKISIFNPDAEALKAKKAAEAKSAQQGQTPGTVQKTDPRTNGGQQPTEQGDAKKPASAPPIPAMSIKDPNFSSKLSGSLLLRSDATFTPILPSEHGEMTKKFRTAHQAANDEIADKIVAGVKSGKLAPDKRGKVPYDQDMAEKEIRGIIR